MIPWRRSRQRVDATDRLHREVETADLVCSVRPAAPTADGEGSVKGPVGAAPSNGSGSLPPVCRLALGGTSAHRTEGTRIIAKAVENATQTPENSRFWLLNVGGRH